MPLVTTYDPIPLSLLNDFLYCPRRAALKLIEGSREANQHTLRGDIVHEHADLSGYESQISNLKSQILLLRALPVWSERLGLSGKCDIVEQRSDGSLFPVEFKLGKRRQWENDDVQVCAQALCLEEMFKLSIPRGAIFHADSKRRREVEFTPELRKKTEAAARDLHALLRSTVMPSALFRRACEECSLFDICLPKATGVNSRTDRLARTLYEI
ncbi:MAG TPA: CRISPR-associated protein Cas4 [Candidatus Paceibacterota bacterium]|nr:CRISPR-associated protein Cas4 [Verrucomicrobiota bacterium]HRY49616.1 CRISPR-associated protein Cas4 [Candidatus Paceibacterota bacterium]